MKILSRDFTLREKISITILLIIVVCFGYKTLIHDPIESEIAAVESQRETLQTEIMIIESKVANLEKMKQELDEILNDPTISTMPSYNNVKEELAFLNDTLALANSYSINVGDPTQSGDQIRRDVTIQFTTREFEVVKEIVTILATNTDRTLVSSVQISSNDNSGLSCSLLVTFYETMVGGESDTGLLAGAN